MSVRRDGPLVIGARCTADGCGWGPLETEDPDAWDVIERARLEHERNTDHVTTVETAPADRPPGTGPGARRTTSG